MSDMQFDEALALLEQPVENSSLSALMHALAVVCADERATLDHIMLALRQPGIVCETAAIALHRRTGRRTTASIITDEADWRAWLANRPSCWPTTAAASRT